MSKSFQPIETFMDKKYKGIFLKQIQSPTWQPFWQLESDMAHNISFYGFEYLKNKYANTINTKVLYKLPVTLGYYRIKIWDQSKLRIPKGFTNELRNSLKSSKVDMILCPFDLYGIYQENIFHLDLRHATVLILNKILKTIEYYDPMYNIEDHDQDTDNIHNLLTEYFQTVPELSDYRLVSLSTMGYDGFQYIEELSEQFEQYSMGGLCFIWSLFYAEIRLKYYNIEPEVLIKYYLNTIDMDSLKLFIHDYALYLYEKLAKNKSFKSIAINTVKSNIQTYFENSMTE